MSEENISDEELAESIRWCSSVAFGSYTDRAKVTNKPWHKKFLALTELKERRERRERGE